MDQQLFQAFAVAKHLFVFLIQLLDQLIFPLNLKLLYIFQEQHLLDQRKNLKPQLNVLYTYLEQHLILSSLIQLWVPLDLKKPLSTVLVPMLQLLRAYALRSSLINLLSSNLHCLNLFRSPLSFQHHRRSKAWLPELQFLQQPLLSRLGIA